MRYYVLRCFWTYRWVYVHKENANAEIVAALRVFHALILAQIVAVMTLRANHTFVLKSLVVNSAVKHLSSHAVVDNVVLTTKHVQTGVAVRVGCVSKSSVRGQWTAL
jgi:hypothetical protein